MFKYDPILQHQRNITIVLNPVHKFRNKNWNIKQQAVAFKTEMSLEEMSDFCKVANFKIARL